MRKLFVIALFTVALSYLTAETIDFDLRKYQAQEYKSQSANIIFDSRGNAQNSDYDQETKHQYDSRYLNFYLYPSYRYNHYTPHKFKSFSFHSSHNFNYNTSERKPEDSEINDLYKNPEAYSNRYSTTNSIQTEYESQRYLEAKDFFGGFAAQLYFSSDYHDLVSDNSVCEIDTIHSSQFGLETNRRSSRMNILLEPNLLIGHGRLESVFPARKAVYILQALEDNSLLATTPHEAQIIALANLINQINHKRFIDKREAKIYALETILQFLNDNNIIPEQTPRLSALVNDIWDNIKSQRFFFVKSFRIDRIYDAPKHIGREVGSKFSLFAGIPLQYYSFSENSNSERYSQYSVINDDFTSFSSSLRNLDNQWDEIEKSMGATLGLKHQYGNPFRLDWQFSVYNQFSYEYTDLYQSSKVVTEGDELHYDYTIDNNLEETVLQDTLIDLSETIETQIDKYQHQINYFYLFAVGYHYNLRTSFLASIQGFYQSKAADSSELISSRAEENTFISTFSISSKYWISQKLCLNGQINYEYFKQALNNSSQSEQSIDSEKISEHSLGFSFGLDYSFF